MIVYRAKEKHVLSNQINLLSVITTGVAALILLPIEINAALLCFGLSTFLMNTSIMLGLKKYKKFFWASVIRSISTIGLPIVFPEEKCLIYQGSDGIPFLQKPVS